MIKPPHMLILFLLLTGTIAVTSQWDQWPTGRRDLPALTLMPGDSIRSPTDRIWIDTDAACGATTRTDPDDCLAILWLVESGLDIVGISTSFGNAPGDVVAVRTAALVAQMKLDGLPAPNVFSGHGGPAVRSEPAPSGIAALQSALEVGPLTILALGPLTNVAAALTGRPDLQGNVTRIVAVMGHRPGHLFHPTEGKGAGAIFGHGPIFRDLNVSVDPDAVRDVLRLPVPISLIPYDAARTTLITEADMDRLARRNGSGEWVAGTTRSWLEFWKDEVGLQGFYPFDWVAAAYLTDPGRFSCAPVKGKMLLEWSFWVVPHDSLVVEPLSASQAQREEMLHYCPEVSRPLHNILFVP